MNPAVEPSLLAGVNVLIEGGAGSGKTTSLGTAAEAGVELFCLFTESGVESLLGYFTDKGKPVPDNVHWHVLKPRNAGFGLLIENAEKVNTIALDQWSKITDPNRGKFNQYVDLLKVLNDFPDDRTGKRFGPVDSWGPSRMLAIDGLTGLGKFAMALVKGGKPITSQPEWGAAQEQLEVLLRQLCDGCKCHFALISHIERETDQVLGGTKITVSTLGKALAPKIPPMFSDVILAYREGAKWMWSTANNQTDLKTRNLPIADGLSQDFGAIFKKWQSRGGRFTEAVKV